MNVDPAELAKFSELAHHWWDPESEFRPLHQINPLRLDWIARQAPLPGQQVLDVGLRGLHRVGRAVEERHGLKGHGVVEVGLELAARHGAG